MSRVVRWVLAPLGLFLDWRYGRKGFPNVTDSEDGS